jgi:hypothetical protein
MLEVVLLLLDMFIIENDYDLTRLLGRSHMPSPHTIAIERGVSMLFM